MRTWLLQAIGVVVLVCVGVRVAAWLIAPLLPALLVLAVIASLFAYMVGGPRYRGRR